MYLDLLVVVLTLVIDTLEYMVSASFGGVW